MSPPYIVDYGASLPPGEVYHSSSALLANFYCRIIFGTISILICIVPLRLLIRNGELAAITLVSTVSLSNLIAIINAIIWPNDNTEEWWHGEGFCDIQNIIGFPSILLNATCICAIMKNLADQIGSLRAHPLSVKERWRKRRNQSLLIFPAVINSMFWMYFSSSGRYFIFTLKGCAFVPDRSWPTLLFIVLPLPLYCIAATIYAVLASIRYRQISKTTREALASSSTAATRANRARRRLYFMTLCILIPYLPIQLVHTVNNIRLLIPLVPYDYSFLHSSENPRPWNTIYLLPSKDIKFEVLNMSYLNMLTAIPIFIFFGATKDAINIYRQIALTLGIGKLFPSLQNEYDPDQREATSHPSWLRSLSHKWKKGSHEDTSEIPLTSVTDSKASNTHLDSIAIAPELRYPPNSVTLPENRHNGNDEDITSNFVSPTSDRISMFSTTANNRTEKAELGVKAEHTPPGYYHVQSYDNGIPAASTSHKKVPVWKSIWKSYAKCNGLFFSSMKLLNPLYHNKGIAKVKEDEEQDEYFRKHSFTSFMTSQVGIEVQCTTVSRDGELDLERQFGTSRPPRFGIERDAVFVQTRLSSHSDN